MNVVNDLQHPLHHRPQIQHPLHPTPNSLKTIYLMGLCHISNIVWPFSFMFLTPCGPHRALDLGVYIANDEFAL